jgi:hypothetical protein
MKNTNDIYSLLTFLFETSSVNVMFEQTFDPYLLWEQSSKRSTEPIDSNLFSIYGVNKFIETIDPFILID